VDNAAKKCASALEKAQFKRNMVLADSAYSALGV
jgi:hypothetical protein